MTVWPNGSKTKPRVSSRYGPRTPIQTPNGTTSAFHTGDDYVGFAVNKAAEAGVVIYARYTAANGNEVRVQHADGSVERHYHGQRFLVSEGQRVAEGQDLSVQGMTGMATGVHDHFRWDAGGSHHDPSVVIPQRMALEVPLRPEQRRIRTGIGNARARASKDDPNSSYVDIPEGTVIDVLEAAKGRSASDSSGTYDLWFRTAQGWVWAGSTTQPNAAGVASATERIVRSDMSVPNVKLRKAASTSADQTGTLDAGVKVTVLEYEQGQMVEQNDVRTNVWFIIGNDRAWAGGFTNHTTSGLTKREAPQVPVYQLDPSKYTGVTPDSERAVWVGSPNYGKRDPKPKDHITQHWMAGTLPGTDATFQIPGEITAEGLGLNVATTYGIGHNNAGLLAVHQYVREDEYHHGDGNADSNASGIAIEHEGGWTLPDGSFAPVPEDVVEESIELHVDIALRKGWPKLEYMVNVFPHSHYTGTTCPGTLPGEAITVEANRRLQLILNPPQDPDPEPDPDETPGWFIRFIQALAEFLANLFKSNK